MERRREKSLQRRQKRADKKVGGKLKSIESQKPPEESLFIHLSNTFYARLLAGNIVVTEKFLNFVIITF